LGLTNLIYLTIMLIRCVLATYCSLLPANENNTMPRFIFINGGVNHSRSSSSFQFNLFVLNLLSWSFCRDTVLKQNRRN